MISFIIFISFILFNRFVFSHGTPVIPYFFMGILPKHSAYSCFDH